MKLLDELLYSIADSISRGVFDSKAFDSIEDDIAFLFRSSSMNLLITLVT